MSNPSNAIPREVHTWLQSLGLSSSIKNPRRDLASGAVIAHICARYWSDVPLHSFANGASTATKQSNWYVLQKVMKKHGVEVSASMITGMVNGEEQCAAAFLKQLYTVFTGKYVDDTPVPLPEPLVSVPSKDVPVLAPANAAARARQSAAQNNSANGLSSSPPSSSAAAASAAAPGAGGSRGSATSALSAAARLISSKKDEKASGVGLSMPQELYRAAGGLPNAEARSATGTALPPILPPPASATHAAFSAAALSSGKPALNISVRPAGQLSTVLPSQNNGHLSAAGLAPKEGESGSAGGSDVRGGYAPGTSLASLWFCAKVRDALPREAIEEMANSGTATAGALGPLNFSLMWLSAEDGMFTEEFARDGVSDGVKDSQDSMRRAVWASLLSNVGELAELALHHSAHGLDLLVDSLFAAVRDARLSRRADGADDESSEEDGNGRDDDKNSNNSNSSSSSRAREIVLVESSVRFTQNVLRLCSSLLRQVGEVDCHFAVRCFQTHFLQSEPFAAAVRKLQWSVAPLYAELIAAALPHDRGLAAGILESLWSTLEDVVRDSADTDGDADADAMSGGLHNKRARAEVRLLCLARALLRVLVPLERSTAPSQVRVLHASAATNGSGGAAANGFGPAATDGTRTPSGSPTRPTPRLRGAHGASAGAAAATAVEAGAFVALVVRRAHHRCLDAVEQLQRRTDSITSNASVTSLLLLEAVTALAVDLLRVDVASGGFADMVHGDAFFDVFSALLPSAATQMDTTTAKGETQPAPLRPALLVLRARWLRWCLQRRWQLGLSRRGPAFSPSASQPPTPAFGNSTTTAVADNERRATGTAAAGATAATTVCAWIDSEEMSALKYGVQCVCAELMAEEETAVGGGMLVLQQARMLAACALAEAIPFLPTQFKAEDQPAPRGSSAAAPDESSEVPHHTHDDDADKVSSVKNDDGSALREEKQDERDVDADGCHQHHRHHTISAARVAHVCAESAAEAAMHVLMRSSSPPQLGSLLRPPSATPPPKPHFALTKGEERQASRTSYPPSHPNSAAVAVPHPFVGMLLPDGPLVQQSDPLLLVRAMLCVLDSDPTTAKTAERDAAAAARRLGARAAVVAREGQLDAALATRVAWLHALLVEGRHPVAGETCDALLRAPVSEAAPHRSQTAVFDEAVVSQWHAVVMESWDTLMLVLQAATLRLRQRGGNIGAATANANASSSNNNSSGAANAGSGTPTESTAAFQEVLGEGLLKAAREAQGVVCCLERELAPALPGRTAASSSVAELSTSQTGRGEQVTLNSALLSGPLASFEAATSADELQAAVGWMWTVVAGH